MRYYFWFQDWKARWIKCLNVCTPLRLNTVYLCSLWSTVHSYLYINITHTSASASPWGTDGRVASSLLIITVCDLARGKAGRRRVHWGMQLSWERRRAAGQHEKHWSSQSGLPVWCQSKPRPGLLFEGETLFFFPSLSLSLFSQLPHVYPVGHCFYGNVAVRLYRIWLELRRGESCLFI